jgi:hypothetical protein
MVAANNLVVNNVSAGPAVSPTLVASRSFAVLANTAITDVGGSAVTGDVGDVAGGGAAIGVTCSEVTGTIYSPDAAGPLPCRVPNSPLPGQAETDWVAATTVLGGEGCDITYSGVKQLGGLTLVPGVYCADAFLLTGTLTLSGGAGNVWVFKATISSLTTATSSNIVGGDPCNVWWMLNSFATLGTSSHMIGTILASSMIAVTTGATLNGRALAHTASVTLDHSTVSLNCPIGPLTTTTTLESSAFQGSTTLTNVVITIPVSAPIPEYQWGVWLLLILMLPGYMLLKRRILNH